MTPDPTKALIRNNFIQSICEFINERVVITFSRYFLLHVLTDCVSSLVREPLLLTTDEPKDVRWLLCLHTQVNYVVCGSHMVSY